MANKERTLKLTPHEIELIERALLYVYHKKIKILDEFSGLMRKEEEIELKLSADQYANLQGNISGGVKDE